jgi:Interferon-induced transmembrane protein
MTNTQNPAPDWGDAAEWQQQHGPGQPYSGGYHQAPGSAAPQYGPGYQQPAPPYQQAPWQGAITQPIQTYLIPAILVTLFCFLPTGIAAIVYANQVSSKRAAGDIIGAARASKQARMWTIVSLAVGVAVIVIVVIAAAASSGSSSSTYYG